MTRKGKQRRVNAETGHIDVRATSDRGGVASHGEARITVTILK